jgi:S-adenosylmethionine decarboxylase
MKTMGRHLLAEFYDCDAEVIDDLDAVRDKLCAAADAVGATIVAKTFHRYAPQGVSGVVLIAESHMSVHTWPECGYVAVDIYTCGGLDPRPGFRALEKSLGAASAHMHEIVRGLPEEVDAGRPLLPDDVQIFTSAREEL